MNEVQEMTKKLPEVEELQRKIEMYEQLIEDLSAPIIPSIVPDTILVPLTGTLTVERFGLIQNRIVQGIAEQGIEAVVIDFTAISTLAVEENMGYGPLSEKIHELVSVLKLMGTEALFVGFSPAFAQHLILSDTDSFLDIHTFSTFRAGLEYLLDLKGLEIVPKKS